MRILIAVAVLLVAPTAARAQIPIPVPSIPVPQGQDTVRAPAFAEQPPVSPLGALWRSMLVPGWGQSILGRKATGAVFVFWEGVTLTMTLKSIHQKGYLERTGSNNVDNKQQEIEDWAVLLAFNHLLSGAEAFVASMLWDFPAELEIRATRSGDLVVGASLKFR